MSNPMRTIIRYSAEVNKNKFDSLVDTIGSYCWQKDDFLIAYAHIDKLDKLSGYKVRNGLVKAGFVSRHGLKARAWKWALTDALNTIKMYWEAMLVDVRSDIGRNRNFDKDDRIEAFKTLKYLRNIKKLFDRELDISVKVQNYLIRRIRRSIGKRPRVNLYRGACFDADMYSVFVNNKVQYISLMTKGKRIKIPLKGKSKIDGNVRVILNREDRVIEVHGSEEVKVKSVNDGPDNGIDWGMSELFADADGDFWYTNFWKDTEELAEGIDKKMKERNKIEAIKRKHMGKSNVGKVNKIIKNNLGKKKFDRKKQKFKGRIKTEINTAFNKFLDDKRLGRLGVENLSHYKPPLGSGKFSRHASYWMRGLMEDRLRFKMQVRGSSYVGINSAYGSQTCQCCGYVDRKNRSGDRFKCLKCDFIGHADTNSAVIYRERIDDDEIQLWMKPYRVKSILQRRLEGSGERCSKESTVSGKTLEPKYESTCTGSIKERNWGCVFYGVPLYGGAYI